MRLPPSVEKIISTVRYFLCRQLRSVSSASHSTSFFDFTRRFNWLIRHRWEVWSTSDSLSGMSRKCSHDFCPSCTIVVGLWLHFAMVYVLGRDNAALFQPALFSRRNADGSFLRKPLWEVLASSDSTSNPFVPFSHIATIRCENFAGVSGINSGSLELNLATKDRPFSNLVVVTGETGHGKVSGRFSASLTCVVQLPVVLTHDGKFSLS